MSGVSAADDGVRVHLNGALLPLAQAHIHPPDRGFIFGDGVYEVIPVYGGHALRLDAHLERLARSLALTRIPDPWPAGEWRWHLHALIAERGAVDQSIYLQVTRGVAPRDHAFPDCTPTVFMMSRPLAAPPREQVERGLTAVLLDDIRWAHCDIKTTALLPNVLLRQQAVDAQAHEALLLRDGWLTEGAASNAFVVIDGRLCTPPATSALLHGVTRQLLLDLAAAEGMPAEQRAIGATELGAAQEIWLSSSTREVLAVTRLQDAPVGEGTPGPLFRRLRAAFEGVKAEVRAGRGTP